jgi:hypothetical protein
MMRVGIRFAPFFAVAFAGLPGVSHGFSFTPGDFYASQYFESSITHYNSAGVAIETLNMAAAPSDDLRGLAFGPGGAMYSVGVFDTGAHIYALSSTGTIQQTYTISNAFTGGNISYGKIAFGAGGDFYIGTGVGVAKFNTANATGSLITSSGGIFDLEVLPSGNLLVATSYDISEITPSGTTVRQIVPDLVDLTDVRGLEYDPISNVIYATMLGYSDNFFQVMKLNGTTGAVLGRTSFTYADDLFLASDGRLVVGSRTQGPAFFNQSLEFQNSFTGNSKIFVTQMAPVPEPATIAVLGLGALCAIRRRARR